MNDLYIKLIKNVLTDYHRAELSEYRPLQIYSSKWRLPSLINKILLSTNSKLNNEKFVLCENNKFNSKNRLEGKDWPTYADTMIGLKRLNNIEYCVENIISKNIQGDFIETGVWRGGATIFMKALLQSKNIHNRIVWVADSFEGLPSPDGEKFPEDKISTLHNFYQLAIPIEKVKYNFEKYGLLDSNVKFLKGWFKDTLPKAPIKKLSLIRLDGDMYESTMDGLTNLYPKLSKGGYIIIDDWGAVKGCKKAVIDYRNKYGIKDKIVKVDWTGVYWKKTN
jgi:O-methyltransferase